MSHLLDNDDDDEILDLTAAFFQSFIIRKRERKRLHVLCLEYE